MADKKTGKENIRKLQRTGEDGASYSLTIPKHIIKKLGWQERQKLVVEYADGEITISDWQR